ncbi:MAG: carboxymuconolactone decarboxylase family protein [Betaproteobacteria bacterium]
MSRRFPQLAKAGLDERKAALAEKILGVSSIGLGGPYNLLLRSPVLGDRMFELFRYLRWNTSVPLRLNEFAILIIGRIWRSQVEWFAHVPIALKAGLSQSIIDDLKAKRRPQAMQPDEAAVYDFVTELATTHKVSDPVFQAIKGVLNEQQIVDLTATAGCYVTVAMLIAMSEEQVPEGKSAPFSDQDP